jgi:hypothetical protein
MEAVSLARAALRSCAEDYDVIDIADQASTPAAARIRAHCTEVLGESRFVAEYERATRQMRERRGSTSSVASTSSGGGGAVSVGGVARASSGTPLSPARVAAAPLDQVDWRQLVEELVVLEQAAAPQ